MATDPRQQTSPDGPGHHGDGLAKWVLGTLGLLWVGGLALRALRGHRFSTSEGNPHFAGPREASRPERAFPGRLRPLPHPTRGHESRDASFKWIFGIVLFLLISGLIIHGILAWFLGALKRVPASTDSWRPIATAGRAPPSRPPQPALQVSPPLDWQAFQAREQAEMQTYGWINRTAGIVRIPIEQAMEAVLQEGLPTRRTPQENQAGPSSYQLMLQRVESREPESRP